MRGRAVLVETRHGRVGVHEQRRPAVLPADAGAGKAHLENPAPRVSLTVATRSRIGLPQLHPACSFGRRTFEFQHLLQERHIHFDSNGQGGSAWSSQLTYLLPFALFFGFWLYLVREVQILKRRQEDPSLDARTAR
jgi:hypothetical protein